MNVVQRREGRVLVDGDLKSGNVIVVEGTQRMREGIPVSYDIQRFAQEENGDTLPISADPADTPTS